MNEDDSRIIQMDLADAILERPIAFDADGVRFFLYPPSLGKTIIIERQFQEIEFDMQDVLDNPYYESLKICTQYRSQIAKIIALHTCRTKEDIFDEETIENRTDIINNAASDEELASMLVVLLTRFGTDRFIRYLKLDEDKQNLSRVRKCKKTAGSYTFGGKSIYGTIIDYACERYGWTMDYVVWGISYQNVQMLMADAIQSIFLSSEEQKNCHVPNNKDGVVINGDDPESIARMAELFKD